MDIDFIGSIAGLVHAHSAYIGSGQDGELMLPYVIFQSDGAREVQNFEAEAQEDSVDAGHAAIAKYQDKVDAWAYAQEGLVTLDDGSKHDIYLIKAWAPGLVEPIQL